MKALRLGKLLYGYQTTVYFKVHEHAIRGTLDLENQYVSIRTLRTHLFYPQLINGYDEREDYMLVRGDRPEKLIPDAS